MALIAYMKKSPEERKKIKEALKLGKTGIDKFATPPADFFSI